MRSSEAMIRRPGVGLSDAPMAAIDCGLNNASSCMGLLLGGGLGLGNPALSLAGIDRAGIAEHRGPPHQPFLGGGVEPGGGMHQAAIVPYDEIPRVPLVDIDEFGPRQMGHQ